MGRIIKAIKMKTEWKNKDKICDCFRTCEE